jgi:hypothetical protein
VCLLFLSRNVETRNGTGQGGRAHLFQPGHVNEFMLLSHDLHQIHTCKIGHCNDGATALSSRWKLSKVVVTCIQHGLAEEAADDGGGGVMVTPRAGGRGGGVGGGGGGGGGGMPRTPGTAGKGDHAEAALVTTNNHQVQQPRCIGGLVSVVVFCVRDRARRRR